MRFLCFLQSPQWKINLWRYTTALLLISFLEQPLIQDHNCEPAMHLRRCVSVTAEPWPTFALRELAQSNPMCVNALRSGSDGQLLGGLRFKFITRSNYAIHGGWMRVWLDKFLCYSYKLALVFGAGYQPEAARLAGYLTWIIHGRAAGLAATKDTIGINVSGSFSYEIHFWIAFCFQFSLNFQGFQFILFAQKQIRWHMPVHAFS
jgi:hypothetical protein